MQGVFNEWIEKAEADYHSAWRDYRARKFYTADEPQSKNLKIIANGWKNDQQIKLLQLGSSIRWC